MMIPELRSISRLYKDPCKIVTERLGDSQSELKTFSLKHSANFSVFSYEKGGVRRHTFIDAGDFIYRDRILDILNDNNIKPGNIERIIITHHHIDHCGLAGVLAGESGAKILVHANFRSFVEGEITRELRPWLGSFVPARLQRHNIVYLNPSGEDTSVPISGIHFPRLSEPIQIGDDGCLEILACPESADTHSSNQLIVLYSPNSHSCAPEKENGGFRPTDDIIFSGDLWLMQGPLFEKSLRHYYRLMKVAFTKAIGFLSGNPMQRWDPREQDTEAKEALKHGFPLIRVKPGHGEEFLGTRIIPTGLLADRDVLLALGYPMDKDKSILQEGRLASKVSDILEKAHASFVEELLLWMEQGYEANEISALLVRIYREQEGGGSLVDEDRKERRVRLKQTLARLRDETAGTESLRQIAEMTLPKLSF
jgi:hypothetical protein